MKEIQIKENTQVDLKLTKEDIFLVIQQEELDKLNKKLEVLKNNLIKLTNVTQLTEKHILEEFIKSHKIPINCVVSRLLSQVYESQQMYDIDNLSQLKDPKFSKRKFTTINRTSYYKYVIKINVTENYIDKEGFDVYRKKEINVKINKRLQSLLDSLNVNTEKINNLNKEINELEYQIILVNTDNTYKANFIKKIIKNSKYIDNLL